MPTWKTRRSLGFTEAELHRLLTLWIDLRNPGRRGPDLYIGQKLSLNQWIAKLALERAAEMRSELRKKKS